MLAFIGMVVLGLGACEDPAAETSPAPMPPSVSPWMPAPQMRPLSPVAATTPQLSATSDYPLTQQQALALLSAGVAVAGQLRNGFEGLAMKTTETAYEDKQVRRRKCDYEYDYYENADVLKCRDKYVTERVPVEKTIYKATMVRGVPRTFSIASGAIGYISSYGVTGWRRV
ncbi:hypothetical protein ACWCP6_18395 [Streptomyces sp. NPDC002004]